jgi:hypothetical protein
MSAPLKISLIVATAVVGLALTGGCSQPAAPPTPPKPAATPIQTMSRRDGVWKVQLLYTEVSGKRFAMAALSCVGPPSETSYLGGPSDRKGCSAYDLERQPNGDVALHSVCDPAAGAGTTTEDRLIHGDWQTKLTSTDTMVTVGARKPEDNGASQILSILTWERPCKPSEKPGVALAETVVTEAGAPTAPADLDPATLKQWDATK